MSDDHTNAFRGLLGAAVMGVILWIIIGWACYGLWSYFNPCRESRIVPKEIVERMRFHGIHTAYQGHDGKYYFTRGGERCRL